MYKHSENFNKQLQNIKIKIILSIFSDHNAKRLEINKKKTQTYGS